MKRDGHNSNKNTIVDDVAIKDFSLFFSLLSRSLVKTKGLFEFLIFFFLCYNFASTIMCHIKKFQNFFC